MRFLNRFPVAVGSLLCVAGCGGPEVGDIVENEVSLTLTGVTSAPEVAAMGQSEGGLGMTRAFLSASALSLVPCREGASEVTLGARGYDLLSDPPPSEVVTTAVFELCGLRLDIDPVSESASDGVPAGASLYVEGEDASGAPFSVSSERSVSLMFEAESVASFGEQPLLLGFDLSIWLAHLPLPDEPVETSVDLFESQLLDAAALYVDSNGNQALDPDEQTPVAHATTPR